MHVFHIIVCLWVINLRFVFLANTTFYEIYKIEKILYSTLKDRQKLKIKVVVKFIKLILLSLTQGYAKQILNKKRTNTNVKRIIR